MSAAGVRKQNPGMPGFFNGWRFLERVYAAANLLRVQLHNISHSDD